MSNLVDTRPPEYTIPPAEQDLDSGRSIPKDGQDVVDLLADPSAMEEVNEAVEEDAEPEPITDDMGESLFSPTFGFQEMLYGEGGALSSPSSLRMVG